MAKATVKRSQIESATIEFNTEELNTLVTILGNIGGDPRYSPRKHVTAIKMALSKAIGADVDSYVSDTIESGLLDHNNKSPCAIYFKNYRND